MVHWKPALRRLRTSTLTTTFPARNSRKKGVGTRALDLDIGMKATAAEEEAEDTAAAAEEDTEKPLEVLA